VTTRLAPITLPLRSPLATGQGTVRVRRGWLVVAGGDGPVSGYAEALPLPGFCGSEEAIRSGRAWARADRDARARGLSLAELFAAQLGTRPRSRVPVNALLRAETPDAVAAQARAARMAGHLAAKLKLHRGGGALDLERVAAAREGLGSTPGLRVDANGCLDERAALRLARDLEPYHIEYLEQPVPGPDVDALARIRRASPIPIAADEAASGASGLRRVIDLRAADVLVLKPAFLPPDEAIEAVRLGREAGMGVVVTSALDGALGRAAALHLAAALPDPLPPCGLATGPLLADDLAKLPGPEGGSLAVPRTPGLGVVPTPEALQRLRSAPGEELAS
jgi:L-alanine-DL-glutamate epimerase-like enolase superfamily enzyme